MLYLHIGSHKTGTSSIQATFFAGRDRLRKRGISYFGYCDNHSRPILWRFGSHRYAHPVTVNAGMTRDDVDAASAEVEAALTEFLNDPSCPAKVISAEELSTLSRADLEGLWSFLQPFGVRTRIIVYVRNYFDYMNSQMQELVKWGWTLPALIESIGAGRAVYPGYRNRIEKFIDKWGREAVDIRILDERTLEGGDLFADFCSALGAPAALVGLEKTTENVSLSARSVRLLSEYNRLFPTTVEGKPNPRRAPALRAELLLAPGPKFRLQDAAALDLFERRIAPDVTYLRGLLGEDAVKLLTERPPSARAAGETERPDADIEDLMEAFGRTPRPAPGLAERLVEEARKKLGACR
ncbi:MAG TPA: hypothetical protein VGS12_00820 [Caulobacteraceae bacterium]|nr:hypothetical protein [Caulobacteraceae bacterium]